MIWAKGELFVTVGSDHTDRKLETFSVPMSKQAYPNLIPKEVWRYADIKDHWAQVEFECWMTTEDSGSYIRREPVPTFFRQRSGRSFQKDER